MQIKDKTKKITTHTTTNLGQWWPPQTRESKNPKEWEKKIAMREKFKYELTLVKEDEDKIPHTYTTE